MSAGLWCLQMRDLLYAHFLLLVMCGWCCLDYGHCLSFGMWCAAVISVVLLWMLLHNAHSRCWVLLIEVLVGCVWLLLCRDIGWLCLVVFALFWSIWMLLVVHQHAGVNIWSNAGSDAVTDWSCCLFSLLSAQFDWLYWCCSCVQSDIVGWRLVLIGAAALLFYGSYGPMLLLSLVFHCC